jgi:hypothetical protein
MEAEMTEYKQTVGRCKGCSENRRYIAPWGDTDSSTGIVGTQPGDQHPEESECVFGLDLGYTAWSGEVLEDVFEELDYEMSGYYWTNAIKCVEADGNTCGDLLKRELSTFSKILLLGNDTVDTAPGLPGSDVYKLWHPAYVHRNRRKFDAYVRRWRDVLTEESPSTLSDFA